MPIDVQKLAKNKEEIINSIKSRGPSLPVQIGRDLNLGLLFASAYLSELYNERKIKMSCMKVGSSSLYYISGQEVQLENFIQYLNHKEREAFSILKREKILEDEKQEPAIRVAIRAIKDFAIPIRIKLESDSKLFWKYFLVSDEEVKNIVQNAVKKTKKQEEVPKHFEQKITDEKEKQETLVKKQELSGKAISEIEIHIRDPQIKDEHIKNQPSDMQLTQGIARPEHSHSVKSQKKERKKKFAVESKFVKNIKEYLSTKDIELLSIIEEKKSLLVARVRVNDLFGKQEYLLTAKEKKKINDEDLTVALHKAQSEKMPALFLAPGDIDKKFLEHAKLWHNLIKFEKVKF